MGLAVVLGQRIFSSGILAASNALTYAVNEVDVACFANIRRRWYRYHAILLTALGIWGGELLPLGILRH